MMAEKGEKEIDNENQHYRNLFKRGWFPDFAGDFLILGCLRVDNLSVGAAGNTWEWCRDWYGPTYLDKEQKDPLGAATGSARVVRGGSFNIAAYALRSAYRYFYNPVDRTMNNGFRVLWDSTGELK